VSEVKNLAYMKKMPNGYAPMLDISEPGIHDRIKVGEVVQVKMIKPRNLKYHRKFFALLNIGFDAWEPPKAEYKGIQAGKSFNRFRADVIVQAGYYDVVSNINGDVRVEPKSISFGSMDDIEFEALYNSVVNVILQRVLTTYTRENLDEVVEEIIRF
jgi:hypothetical protein